MALIGLVMACYVLVCNSYNQEKFGGVEGNEAKL